MTFGFVETGRGPPGKMGWHFVPADGPVVSFRFGDSRAAEKLIDFLHPYVDRTTAGKMWDLLDEEPGMLQAAATFAVLAEALKKKGLRARFTMDRDPWYGFANVLLTERGPSFTWKNRDEEFTVIARREGGNPYF